MIKVSHEIPLQLMLDGTEAAICDYTYALVHLFDTQPKYFSYVKHCLESCRKVILDNSAFELGGVSYNVDGFIHWIQQLTAGLQDGQLEYLTVVVPDKFDDKAATVDAAKSFPYQRLSKKIRYMAVAQGSTIAEKVSCYEELLTIPAIKCIGLNYASRAYLDWGLNTSSIQEKQSTGRKIFVEQLYHKKLLQRIQNHLLGTAVPSEIRYYTTEHKALEQHIQTMDTSGPVMSGLFNEEYLMIPYNGIFAPPKRPEKLADHLLDSISDLQKKTIIRNCMLFRQMNHL